MEIGTYFQIVSTLTTSAAATPSSGSSSSTDAQTASLFGPAFQLSLGDTSQSSGVGVCSVYSNIIANGGVAPLNTTAWQFDLTGVMSAAGNTLAPAQRSPEQTKAEDAAVQQALSLIDQGEYEDARTLVNQVLSQNKTNAAALQALGDVELSEAHYDQAEQLFLKAHALNPTVGYDQDASVARILQSDDQTVLKKAGVLVATSTQRDSGIRVLVELTKRSPDLTAAHVTLGEALLNSGDATNGLMQFSSAIGTAGVAELGPIESRLNAQLEITPNSAFVLQLLGKAQVKQGKFGDALRSLSRAADLAEDKTPYERDLAKAYVGIGREKLTQGDLTGAMFDFEQAKTLNPTGPDVKAALAEGHVRRAELATNRRDYDSAAADYASAANLLGSAGNKDLRQRAADGAYKLGLALEKQRIAAGADIDKEATAFQAAYDFDPTDTTHKRKLANVRSALGDQYLADDDPEAAAAAYRQAHELFQYDATYKAKAIDAYVAYGDDRLWNLRYTDAIDAYKQAFQLDASNTTSKTKLAAAYTARGLDYREQGKMKEAAVDLKNALHLFPDNPDYQSNYNSVSPWDT